MAEPFTTSYRPRTLKEVVGQDAVVKSLKVVIEDKAAQTFLFAGPSGTGKTTLARIAAGMLGARSAPIEIDGATYTGVDDMRQIRDLASYTPFGGGARAIIVDEAHRLSKQAWESLLKAIEEPGPNTYWFFCTTDPGKVPPTIKTRAATYTLQPVPEAKLRDLIEDICAAEKIKLAEGVATLITRAANGSPRQALSNLAITYAAASRREAADLLQAVSDADPVIELCRFLLNGGSYLKALHILNKLDLTQAEGIRIIICNYVTKALLGAKSDKGAVVLLNVLDAFGSPYGQSDGAAQLLLSVGRVLFPDN